jgi:hypothetical protein
MGENLIRNTMFCSLACSVPPIWASRDTTLESRVTRLRFLARPKVPVNN